MAGNLQYVLLLLVLISIEQCIGIGLPLPQPQSKAPKMPKSLFSSLRNMSSTQDFLKSKKMYQQEKTKGVLPSQMKVPAMLKSRSSGGAVLQADMVNLDLQTCVVRPYIYFLKQPPQIENAFIWPHAVKIPRCIGSCSVRHDIVECRGKTKVEIPLQVYRVPYHSSRKRRDAMEEFAKLKVSDPVHELRKRSTSTVQSYTVKLEAHTDCQCECAVTKEMCAKENKILNQDFCQCECPAVQKCTLPFRWDESQCKCVCGEDRYQSQRKCYFNNKKTYWDHNKCACVCFARYHCSSYIKAVNVFDGNTCECSCATNATCPANQSLRMSGKMCYCI